MIRGFFNFLIAWLVLFATIGYCLFQLFQPNFLGTQAKNVDLYDHLANDAGGLISSGNLNGISLTSDQSRSLVISSIDSGTFYDFFTKGTNAYTQWLTGRTNSLNFSYPISTIKDNLQTNLTNTFVSDYQNLPTCTTSQLKTWQASNGLPSCQLPSDNTYASSVNTLLAGQAESIVDQLPDTITSTSPSQGLLKARLYITEGIKVIELIWLITAGLIILYLALFRTRAFFSLAFIFILAGLLEIGFGLIGWDYLTRLITDSLNNANQVAASAIIDLAGAALNALKTTLGNLSIISLALGTVFLVAGLFFRFRKKAK